MRKLLPAALALLVSHSIFAQNTASTGTDRLNAFAAQQAELWKSGLAKWNQDGERIARLKNAADFAIYVGSHVTCEENRPDPKVAAEGFQNGSTA